jgi:hypothetical protein
MHNILEDGQRVIYAKSIDFNTIQEISKRDKENWYNLSYLLDNSFYNFRKIYGNLFKSVWININRKEKWLMEYNTITDDNSIILYRVEMSLKDIKIIVDSDISLFSQKFCMYLADNYNKLDEAFEKLKNCFVQITIDTDAKFVIE